MPGAARTGTGEYCSLRGHAWIITYTREILNRIFIRQVPISVALKLESISGHA